MLTRARPDDRAMITSDILPTRLLKLALRLAQLQPGRAYTVTIWMPPKSDAEPTWSVTDLGKIENDRR